MKLSDEEAFGEDSRETSRGSSPWQVVGGSAGYADGHGAGGDAYDEDGKLEGEEEHGLLGERMVGRSTQEDTYPPHSPRNSDDGVMLPKRSMELPRSPSFSSRPTSAFVRALVIETSPSLLLSMVGGVLTGVLLESMQGWTVFIRVEELFILTPVVMNLKGNLEMNLAARLSTASNVGDLDIRETRNALISGNLSLLQVQALIVSFIASLLSFLLGLLSRNDLPTISHLPGRPGNKHMSKTGWTPGLRGSYYECVMVLGAGMLAASLSSAVLGTFMCGLILLCRRYLLNPDNITTPVAAALGDLLTLLMLGSISSFLLRYISTLASTLLVLVLVVFIGLHSFLTFRNPLVRPLLSTGWTPLFLAMSFSSGAGLVLERYVNAYEGYGLFAPVVTMVAGNTGAIFVSRLSTALHSRQEEPKRLVGTVLFAIGVASLFLFELFIWMTGQADMGPWLAFAVLASSAVNVAFSLVFAVFLCDQLWKRKRDPDVYALPLLSSICDVTGQLLLVLAFVVANSLSGGGYATEAVSGDFASNTTSSSSSSSFAARSN